MACGESGESNTIINWLILHDFTTHDVDKISKKGNNLIISIIKQIAIIITTTTK